MITKELKIKGMTCGHCVKAVEIELAKLDLAEKTVEIGLAKITFDENKVTEKELVEAVEEAGFKLV